MVKKAIHKIIKEDCEEPEITDTKEYFYIPPENELKNLKDETRDFTWAEFPKFGPVRTAYYEIFIQQDYKHGRCQIEKGDIVLDVGANVGIFTRYNFAYLRRNKPETCSAFNLAVSDNNDEQDFYVKELEGSHTLIPTSNEAYAIQKIQCITFDKIFEEHKLDKIDFIKMDIEGGEIKAFDGITDEHDV